MLKRITNLKNVVLLVLLGIALTTSLISLILNVVNGVESTAAWWVAWLQNMSTEMFGAILTFVLIERIVGGREKRREKEEAIQREKEKQLEAIQQEKSRLIRQMGSQVKSEAIRAVEEMWQQGWLKDGSLCGAFLNKSNLAGANFWDADLRGVWLCDTKLQGTDFYNAKLQEANLRMARLDRARLTYCNLKSADLAEAQLHGTDLRQANLEGVRLVYANFDENTILPDSSNWTPDTDLHRFTDPSHPKFWRSDNPASPAYRGKTETQ
jgi:hypothetical protein